MSSPEAVRAPSTANRRGRWTVATSTACLLTALVLLSRWIPSMWACDLHCAGVLAWSRPFGVDIIIPAAAAMLLSAVLILMRRQLAAVMVIGASCGGALAYLALAVRLEVRCDHCLVSHGAIFITALVALLRAPVYQRLGALGAGLLSAAVLSWRLSAVTPEGPINSLALVKNPELRPSASAAFTSTATAAFMRLVESGRRLPARVHSPQLSASASASAATLVELGLDVHCSHCGEILAALPAWGERHPHVAVRLRLIARDDIGRDLARHLLATAADGPERFLRTLTVCLGKAPGTSWNNVRGIYAELAEPLTIETRARSFAFELDALIASDAVMLRTATRTADNRPLRAPTIIIFAGERILGMQTGLTLEDLPASPAIEASTTPPSSR